MKGFHTIDLTKTKMRKRVGKGAFSTVIRISKKRVVKVFDLKLTDKTIKRLVKDEVKGSKIYKDALPVLKEVVVKGKKGKVFYGLLKEYLPYKITKKDIIKSKAWDKKRENFRKKCRNGKPYLIDTQTRKTIRIMKTYPWAYPRNKIWA